MLDLQIIVPVLNEEESIQELVYRIDGALKKVKVKYGIIFIDDKSTDNTINEIRKLQKEFNITYRTKAGLKGKAYSILEGSRVAEAPVLAMIDGDLQYPPEALPEMYELSKEYGVVVANRKKEKISRVRRLGSDASTGLVGKVLLGLSCDAQSGLKLFKREIIEEISEADVKPWALDMPLLHTAREMGEKVGTVEIEFETRQNGESKVSFMKTAFEISSTALKLKLGRKKTRSIHPDAGSMMGAGVSHNRKKFITHTTLPHNESALFTLMGWQKWAILWFVLAVGLGLLFNYLATLIVLVAALSAIYFADVLFSAFVLLKSLHFPPELSFSDKEINGVKDKELPVYTVLCPLYKEGNVLPAFVDAMKKMDWPKKKLEVLILLEEDDEDTLRASKKLNLPSYIKIVIVPDSQPRTKPKACNYGLLISKGEYVVIYDAEDRPDPSQLKKAYLGFKKLGSKVFCLQSKLNYFNPDHNVLTRLFTAEYSLWFDVVLPGLQSIESSIPLGGTSNHFRVKDLIKLHAWDPFNVTEDCDLGVRIFKAGGKTAIIDSTTLEEANSSWTNWIRQRSRWIKGYMQTYLVHMREPRTFFKAHGIHAVIFQLIIGMRMTFMLINPFLWIMTIAYFVLRSTVGEAIEALYPAPVFYMAAFALVTGNFMYIYNYMIGCAKRGHYGLIKFVFLIPVYWVFASIAAFKAIYQLIVKPHFWEKTNHGLHLPIVPEKKKKEVVKIKVGRNANSRISLNFIQKVRTHRLRGATILVFAVGLSNVFGFLYNTYLGRNLSPSEFGLVALVANLVAIISLPVGALSATVGYRGSYLVGKYSGEAKQFWEYTRRRARNTAFILTILWLAASYFLANLFKAGDILPFLLSAPILSIAFVSAVDRGFLYANFSFTTLAAVVSIESLSKYILAILLVSFGLEHLIYAAIPLSMVLPLYLSWKVSSKSKPSKTKEINILRKFPKKFFGISMMMSISSIGFLSLDIVLAKYFLDPVSAGHYTLLSVVGKTIYMVGQLFSQFTLPVVSRAEGENKDTWRAFLPLFLLTAFFVIGAYIAFGLLGFISAPILLGENGKLIVPFLSTYGLALVFYTLSTLIVDYHLVLRRYIFPIVGFLMSFVQIVALAIFHRSLPIFVNTVLGLSIFYFVLIICMHYFYSYIQIIYANIKDFVGLFLLRINGKKSLGDGKLRILVYNWRDTKHIWSGGAEVYVHELAKRWVDDGHIVTLFCGNDGYNKREENIDGIKVLRRGGFYTVYLWAFLYYLLHFRRRFDVVVESENGVPFFTPLYSTKPKVLIVHHVHQEVFRKHLRFPLSEFARFVELKVMPLVYRGKTIIAVSESTKKDIAKTSISSEENILIVSPGVDNKMFNRTRKTKEPSFVYLGRHKEYKNIDVAIRAFAQVHNKYPKAKLTVAGEGEITEYLKGLATKLSVRRAVSFPGKVSEDEKVKLLGSSWAAIQPSSFEGWGITVIEANACGTPVIASKVSGLSDSVLDGKTGLLVPEKDINSFAKAMIGVIEDKNFRKQMESEAYKWAQGHDWKGCASNFLNIIVETANKRNDSRISTEVAASAN